MAVQSKSKIASIAVAAKQCSAFEQSEVAPKLSDDRLQLDYIDGMRALAAVYVVLHHTSGAFGIYNSLLAFGHEAVDVFLTISGFCLALPLARRNVWRVETANFLRRRARRILPPYYAALAFSFVLAVFMGLSGVLHIPSFVVPWHSLLLHAFMVHNWVSGEEYTLNGPLWSVALECQIYLLFPALILLRRKLGAAAMLLASFLLAHGIYHLTGHHGPANMLFLFAEGVFGADVAFARSGGRRGHRTLAVLLLALIFYTATVHHQPEIADDFVGAATAAFLAWLAHRSRDFFRELLSWKPLAFVGTFSYSIYLVHSPLQLYGLTLLRTQLPHWSQLSMLIVLYSAAPVLIGVSYVFHLGFERPFLSGRRQTVEQRLQTVS